MSSRLLTALAVLSLFTGTVRAADTPSTDNTTAKRYGTWGVDLAGMDTSVKPGDNFFKYVNGKWVASTTIPADQTSYGAFLILRDLSEARVHGILDKWAADKTLKPGSDEAKVATVYRAFLDADTAEKLDAKPLQPYVDAVRAAKTREDVATLIGKSEGSFGTGPFASFINDDQKNPDKYTLYLTQAGLGLPDREFYINEKFKEQKEHYQQYVAQMLTLAGWDNAEKNAADVVAFETKLADAQWSRAQNRDRDKTYNPTTFAELEKTAPGFPWMAYAKAAGIEKADKAIVRQNTAFAKLAQVYADTPVDTLKAYEAFHIADDAAPLLSRRFVDANWEFHAKFLNGVQEQRPRWKRAVGDAERAMGEAIGRTYVAEYFPPDSKAKMEALVGDLRVALKARIQNLEWMSPETKAKALDKLSKFTVRVGYPVRWRDYSNLQVAEGDIVGNAERAAKFRWNIQTHRIGKTVDKEEWGMTPQTVNAYYNATRNEIVFPAAILQPPFFDPQADMAVNFGGIGSVIGHENTHGFDDQGRKSDGNGVLTDWWTKEDAAKFEAQAAKLGAQYEAIDLPNLPGIHINGKATMGENIGDLGGVLTSLDAYHLYLNGKPAPVIDGFSGDQRFFLGFAQVWRSMQRDQALRQQVMTDPHSPGMVRAYEPLRNIDAWYTAFDVKPGYANYIKPEDRVRMW